MNPYKVAGTNYMPVQIESIFPFNFSLVQNDLPSNQPSFGAHELAFQPQQLSCSSSTSDEVEEQHQKLIDERKRRRMISNRESARRSRMRKKRQLHELWSQVVRLRMENHDLMEKLNNLSESHDQILLENKRLKEEVSNLRQMMTYLPLNTDDFHSALTDLEAVPCTTEGQHKFET